MTIRSMTGYATSTAQADGWVVSVEIRSVNHGGLDVRLRVPNECAWAEAPITKRVRRRLHRGRVELNMGLDFAGDADKRDVNYIDADRFGEVCHELRELSKATATGPMTLRDVLEFRSSFQNTTIAQVDQDNDAVLSAVDAAIDELVDSRRHEGRGLADDMRAHLEGLAANLEQLGACLPDEIEAFRGRLAERVSEAVADFEVGELDEQRLAQELAYYADKSDVSEELQRCNSHIDTLADIIDGHTADQDVGKTVDFYLQELIRETNTMGSKSQSAHGTDIVIDMKATVERMREQAANIE